MSSTPMTAIPHRPAACARCGCTDDHACAGGCWWVEPRLCSRCDGLPTGAELIARERRRQIKVEGYDPAHDREHGPLLLRQAAAAYVWGDRNMWPRSWEWKSKDKLRDLIRAGALFQAAADIPDIDPFLKMSSETSRDNVARLIDELLTTARAIDRGLDR